MSEVQHPTFCRTSAGALAAPPEYGYLIVPASARHGPTCWTPSPAPTPGAVRVSKAGKLASQPGCSRPHTTHLAGKTPRITGHQFRLYNT